MTHTIAIIDETTGGPTERRFELELPTPTVSVREIIRSRVFEEAQRFRSRPEQRFLALVQPKSPSIDWHEQVEVALEAFASGRILILVDDQQVRSLDEEVALREGTTEVTFLRLVPLIGG